MSRALESEKEGGRVMKEKEKLVEKIEVQKIPLTREQLFRLALSCGIIQHCKGPKREYFRIRPYTYDFPTKRQLKQRLRLAVEAYKRFGEKGTVTLPDGRRISRVAYELSEVLKGPVEPKEKPILTDEQVMRILERFRLLSLKV